MSRVVYIFLFCMCMSVYKWVIKLNFIIYWRNKILYFFSAAYVCRLVFGRSGRNKNHLLFFFGFVCVYSFYSKSGIINIIIIIFILCECVYIYIIRFSSFCSSSSFLFVLWKKNIFLSIYKEKKKPIYWTNRINVITIKYLMFVFLSIYLICFRSYEIDHFIHVCLVLCCLNASFRSKIISS